MSIVLREVMVWPEILGSKRVTALHPYVQLFYRNLMHACDGAGRFENEARLLASALYPQVPDRVTEGKVRRYLLECQRAGLIAFYTDDKGRGLGAFVDWKQRDKRKNRYPAPPNNHGELPGLFLHGPAPPVQPNRIEENPPTSPPQAGGGASASGSSRRTRNPARRAKALAGRLSEVERELDEILRPGGCAYNVAPTGAKKERYDRLMQERQGLIDALSAARSQLRECA